jgi:hypothetical protein
MLKKLLALSVTAVTAASPSILVSPTIARTPVDEVRSLIAAALAIAEKLLPAVDLVSSAATVALTSRKVAPPVPACESEKVDPAAVPKVTALTKESPS